MSSLKELREIESSIRSLIIQKEFEEFSQNANQLYESDFPAFNEQFLKLSYLVQAKIYSQLSNTSKIHIDSGLGNAIFHLGFKTNKQKLIEAISSGSDVDPIVLRTNVSSKDVFTQIVRSNYLKCFDLMKGTTWCNAITDVLLDNDASDDMIRACRKYQVNNISGVYSIYWDSWLSKTRLTPERRDLILFLKNGGAFCPENAKFIKEVYP